MLSNSEIREKISEVAKSVHESHQTQIDELAEALLEEATGVAEALETRRLEISKEEESRIEKDKILQSQIDTLSNAILNIVLTISELREQSRKNQEE